MTISDENKLSKAIKELSAKNKVQEYVINGKLQEKDEQINNLQESIKFLSDRFNAFLISQPENKIVYDRSDQIKRYKLKPEIKNKVFGQIMSSNSNKKKK